MNATQPNPVTGTVDTPPPLPTSGPAELETLPETPVRTTSRETSSCLPRAGISLSAPVRTYLVFMAFFVVLWAVSGGGHFWPIWPMLGWGLGLVNSGALRR